MSKTEKTLYYNILYIIMDLRIRNNDPEISDSKELSSIIIHNWDIDPVNNNIEPESNIVNIPAQHTSSIVINNMAHMESNINGWNSAASKTISNWYNVFREYEYIYQHILDTNQRISSRLNMISTISSSTLGIFSAFKLWLNDEKVFRTTSDIILMMFNFGTAIVTNASKRYLDDARNEKIRIYIEEIDSFLGEISAQLLKMPEYRMNAVDFLNKHNDTYTKLIVEQPALSIQELNDGKKLYKQFISCKTEPLVIPHSITIDIAEEK